MTTKKELKDSIDFLQDAANSVPMKYFDEINLVLDRMKDDLDEKE